MGYLGGVGPHKKTGDQMVLEFVFTTCLFFMHPPPRHMAILCLHIPRLPAAAHAVVFIAMGRKKLYANEEERRAAKDVTVSSPVLSIPLLVPFQFGTPPAWVLEYSDLVWGAPCRVLYRTWPLVQPWLEKVSEDSVRVAYWQQDKCSRTLAFLSLQYC